MIKNYAGQTLSVIIVNWNGKNDTLQCLSSLSKIDKKGMHIRIIVVDNGSTDGSLRIIAKKYPDVVTIPLERNFGFTGGNNAGITYALDHGSDIVWLLNNDTFVDK